MKRLVALPLNIISFNNSVPLVLIPFLLWQLTTAPLLHSFMWLTTAGIILFSQIMALKCVYQLKIVLHNYKKGKEITMLNFTWVCDEKRFDMGLFWCRKYFMRCSKFVLWYKLWQLFGLGGRKSLWVSGKGAILLAYISE